ncbi:MULTISPECIES: TetR/AcrR family transcriptional regulator [unclassified Micromonospora]|uniref:TetR/AcrR family transcriptional regulator n=1 Tax=unclassified Micromonospora TaxID=2617518 RepID=UPI001B392DA7|nr:MULTISPECIES: TetR/AcrR family transcriptional regulator [unclassified Micromonospora]MBQ1046063.1 TetR/AcrR family transcriptional regulator C-terminal domain-containing protein [Micromonospora sp. C72]MBQ1057782.1 TetR/AcrR family transcriptional regulator C-terminal domain-containing protein [Micromonospora sp. C32]
MSKERRRKADPARSLALLWRTREPASRGAGPGLSVERIVRAAVEIADAEGIDALTMRRVSEALGVGTMSVYTYVPGKAELLDVMVDAVLGDLPRPADVPGGWRGRLERIARDNLALYRSHPWLLRAETTRPVLGPNVLAKYDYELRAVADIGLDDVEMDAVLTLVLGHAKSAARAALDVAELERETGMTDDQWWQTHGPWLEKFMTAGSFPLAARVGTAAGMAHGAAYGPDHAFEFGLQRVLDGISVVVAERAGGEPGPGKTL